MEKRNQTLRKIKIILKKKVTFEKENNITRKRH